MNTTTSAAKLTEVLSAEFDFTVDKFPLAGPDGLQTPWYGLFRSDDGSPVGNGSVTSRYVPHQTDDIIALAEAASEAFDDEMDLRCGFRDGHYVALAPTKAERKAIFGTTDNVFPRIVIKAGYDGKAFQASVGYYRDLCRNMAMLRSVTSSHTTIRHTSSLRPRMNELIRQFQDLKGSWRNVTATIEAMQSRTVALDEFLIRVYGEPKTETGRGRTIHENRTRAICERVLSERAKSGRGAMDNWQVSLWEAFNGVQGYTQWDATRKGNPDTFSRVISAMADKSVQKAEDYAMSLLTA